jgi:hypothetical protein
MRNRWKLTMPLEWCGLERFDEKEVARAVGLWVERRRDLGVWREELSRIVGSEAERVAARAGLALLVCAEPGGEHLVTGTADVVAGPNPFGAVEEIARGMRGYLDGRFAGRGAGQVGVVELGGVAAVRVRYIDVVGTIGGDPATRVGVDRVQYFVPGEGDALVSMDFSTPFLAFGDELAAQWDGIAGTFEWAAEPSGWIGAGSVPS